MAVGPLIAVRQHAGHSSARHRGGSMPTQVRLRFRRLQTASSTGPGHSGSEPVRRGRAARAGLDHLLPGEDRRRTELGLGLRHFPGRPVGARW